MRDVASHDDSDEFDVDEPEEFEESGSDWDPEEEVVGNKRKGRPNATSPKKLNLSKKKKTEESKDGGQLRKDRQTKINDMTPNVTAKAFTVSFSNMKGSRKNGSFVILKSDMESNDNPPLWKIDGKALLQKYVPFDKDGKTLYKNTSTYSGWTQSNQANYIPASITYVQQGKKEIIVEFNRDEMSLSDDKDDVEDNKKQEVLANDPISLTNNT